jgi:hypothetical protein
MSISNLLAAINKGGGLAKSNLFTVWFEGLSLSEYAGINSKSSDPNTGKGGRVLFLCDEATLPGVQSNTGSITRYSGAAPRNYPTNPIYTDTQLSFICDAEMTQLKFLNDWRKLIYDPEDENGEVSNRLQYPKNYQCIMNIEKNERSSSSDVGKEVLTYKLYNAWPYAVDSIPLSYGSSQLVKVTANFYYTHWKTF